jgi:hypothetical protein
MGPSRLLACAALACALFSGIPRSTRAQEATAEDSVARARAHYERGVGLFDEDQFAAALAEFEAAYAISGRPALLFNIGQIHARLGRAVESADALQRYLDEVGAEVPAERRALVEAEIATQRGRIARVTVTADVDGALVSLDDVDRGATPLPEPLRVSAGEHLLRVSADGHETAQQRFRVAGGEERALVVDLVALTGPGGAASSSFPTITVIGAAVGGLGLVTFGAAGLVTLLQHQSLTAETGGCAPSCTAQEVATIDVTRVVADAGLAVLVVGGVLTVVGAVLELGGSSETAGPSVSLGAGGVEVWW